MNNVDTEYFRLLQTILKQGRRKSNRTGVDTIGVFGEQAKYEVSPDAFPILTTKKIFFKAIVHELLWFISGDTNIKYLADNNVHIWDDWAYKRYIDACRAERDRLVADGCDVDYQETKMDAFIERIKNDAKFAEKWGELGEGTYGSMWRNFPFYTCLEDHAKFWKKGIKGDFVDNWFIGRVDQLDMVMDKLQANPDDRRMIVSAWHPFWVEKCALPPCHCMFHFNTELLTVDERFAWAQNKINLGLSDHPEFYTAKSNEDVTKWMDRIGAPTRRVNLLLYQRSCDTFLGVPFNITSYSLLLAMVAHCAKMVPGTFTHTYGDLHIYENHMEQVNLQLSREPKALPKLWLNPAVTDLFKFKYEDIKLEGYDPHPAIKGEVAV